MKLYDKLAFVLSVILVSLVIFAAWSLAEGPYYVELSERKGEQIEISINLKQKEKTTIGDVGRTIADFASDAVDTVSDAATEYGGVAWDWCKGAANDTGDWISGAANDTWNWTKGAANDVGNWVVGLFE